MLNNVIHAVWRSSTINLDNEVIIMILYDLNSLSNISNICLQSSTHSPSQTQWIGALSALLNEISTKAPFLAEIQAKETGKPVHFCEIEVMRCMTQIRQAIEFMHTNQVLISNNCQIKKIPVGRVLALTTFSSPYSSIFHKLLPAMLSNNIFLICVSPLAYNCSKYLFEMIERCLSLYIANINQHIFLVSNLIPPESVITHFDFQYIMFTGKTQTAASIKKVIGYKRGTFETGSNALAYIDSSCKNNLKKVAHKLIHAAFDQSGQRCIALKNLFIQANFVQPLLNSIVEFSSRLKIGNPLLADTVVGPLFPDHLRRLINSVEDLESHGYQRLCGEQINDNLLKPIILLDKFGTYSSIQELYGPVLCVHVVNSLDDINADYWMRSSLSSSCYSEDLHIQQDFILCCNSSGSICINCGPDYRNDLIPFGGFYYENDGKEDFHSLMHELYHEQYIFNAD